MSKLTQATERRGMQHLLPQQILPKVRLVHHHLAHNQLKETLNNQSQSLHNTIFWNAIKRNASECATGRVQNPLQELLTLAQKVHNWKQTKRWEDVWRDDGATAAFTLRQLCARGGACAGPRPSALIGWRATNGGDHKASNAALSPSFPPAARPRRQVIKPDRHPKSVRGRRYRWKPIVMDGTSLISILLWSDTIWKL